MTKPALGTSQLRAVWGPPCSPRLITMRFWTGVAVTVDARIGEAFAALDAIFHRHGYLPRGGVTGAYVCRAITGGTGYSLHAYGIAIDVNWDTNPYSAANRTVTDMPAAMIADIVALRTRSDAPVWGWGGHYRSIKDTMHFEIVCTPADLATGIGNPPPSTESGDLIMAGLIDDFRKELVNADDRAKARETLMVKLINEHTDEVVGRVEKTVRETKRIVSAVALHMGMTQDDVTSAAKPSPS